ncbi:MAG: ATP-binding protein [Pseudonocardia sp.]
MAGHGGDHEPLVGRSRELAALGAHIDRAPGGRGSLLLVVGEPGIGKTHLVDDGVDVGTADLRGRADLRWAEPRRIADLLEAGDVVAAACGRRRTGDGRSRLP